MRILLIVVLVIAVLGAASVGGAAYGIYRGQSESGFARAVASALRLPAAKVGNQTILYSDYIAHVDAQRVYLSGPDAMAQGLSPEITSAERNAALDRSIRSAAVEEMAAERDLVFTQLDVERAYDELVARAGTSTSREEIQNFLRDQFGWTEDTFKRYVIRPALIEDTLRQKRYQETNDPEIFDRELDERLKREDVVRYLTL